jgi:hypothetical protein
MGRRIWSEAGPGKDVRPYLVKTKAKRAESMTPVVECLPSKDKALKFKPWYHQTRQNKIKLKAP